MPPCRRRELDAAATSASCTLISVDSTGVSGARLKSLHRAQIHASLFGEASWVSAEELSRGDGAVGGHSSYFTTCALAPREFVLGTICGVCRRELAHELERGVGVDLDHVVVPSRDLQALAALLHATRGCHDIRTTYLRCAATWPRPGRGSRPQNARRRPGRRPCSAPREGEPAGRSGRAAGYRAQPAVGIHELPRILAVLVHVVGDHARSAGAPLGDLIGVRDTNFMPFSMAKRSAALSMLATRARPSRSTILAARVMMIRCSCDSDCHRFSLTTRRNSTGACAVSVTVS